MSCNIGVLFTETNATAALVERGLFGRKTNLQTATVAIDPEIWRTERPDLRPALEPLARRLGSRARRADVQATIALPDPAVTEIVLDFSELPKNAKELSELVSFSAARSVGKSAASIVCRHEPGGKGQKGEQVIVRIVSARLWSSMLDAAERASLRLTRLEALSRFGACHGDQSSTSGLHCDLFVGGGWWSLAINDRSTRTSRTWSQWREEASLDDIAQNVLRLIKSYGYAREPSQALLHLRTSREIEGPMLDLLGRTSDSGWLTFQAEGTPDEAGLASRLAFT